jgi:hypothetical protein
MTTTKFLASWPSWRAAYFSDLEQLAETLRPEFEAGRLYTWRGSEDDTPAAYELERLCAAHFGFEGDEARAHLILAASPHAAATGEWMRPCNHAKEAVAWDVIEIARERGWYTPPKDEAADPLHAAEAA